jgi:N-succinyldiaminopimelate aminotransferase
MTDAQARRAVLTSKLDGFGTTIFSEMSALAAATSSVNLGQGFPDTDGPRVVLDAAVAEIEAGRNQYPPGAGVPALRAAVAHHQSRFYGMSVDPDREVLVTAGATEALASAMLALLDDGDEAITFQPMYDSYAPCIAMAGATVRPVLLQTPGYRFDLDELRRAVTPRTRLILLNTPHNPTGKVFSLDELAAIASVAVEHDLLVVTDEVYEHLVFDGLHHRPIATLPGMAERTLTISSGGKTFSTTGWKVGWMVGPEALVAAARTAKQFLTYVSSGPFQAAIAAGLALPDEFYENLRATMQSKRDRLTAGLGAAGFTVLASHATYFVTVDIRPLRADGDGMAFCRALPDRCGVVAIPNEVFYATDPASRTAGRHLVRFAYCKRDEVLDDAVHRLARLAGRG